jgi:hypothetical protein
VSVRESVQHRARRLAIDARHDDVAACEQRRVGGLDELGMFLDASNETYRFGVARRNVDLAHPTDILVRRHGDAREVRGVNDVSVEQHELPDAEVGKL